MWRLSVARGLEVERASSLPEAESTSLCCNDHLLGDADVDHAHDDVERQRLLDLREAFWQEREAQPFWSVPMGHDDDIMPWLPKRSAGIVEAIHRARTKAGKTALLVDNTADKVVDTFFMYRSTQILEAKQMVVDERMRKKNRTQILEGARQRLVNAMRYGQTFYIRMSNTATSFKTYYTSPTTLPLAVFDQSCVDSLRASFTPPGGDNLYGSDHPLAGALRESDTDHGFFQCRHGFEVVVSTHLAKDDVDDVLARALPMDKLQPIVPVVKPRAADGKTETCDEPVPDADAGGVEGRAWTSVEEAHEAAIRLRERVEAARDRRAGRVVASDIATRDGGNSGNTKNDRNTRLCAPTYRGCLEMHHASISSESRITIVPADLEDAPPPVTRCFASSEELDRERQIGPAQHRSNSTSSPNTDLIQSLQRTLV